MYTVPFIQETLFPRSAAYRKLISLDEIHESSKPYFPYTERHLHALWFDDHLRPGKLKTIRGESVIVKNPGRWNLEAGPDFLGAVLLIGRERRRVSGDVEIHKVPNDWKRHGHHTDPRYCDVRFHITWFQGSINDTSFSPGTIHIALGDACSADLDSLDLSAYPYQEPRACATFPMGEKHSDEIIQTLENAGEERLRQKTLRLIWLIQRRGKAQALYEETAVALGYKHNKTPFRQLAQCLQQKSLRSEYNTDWKTIYAVLLGVSGLLPKQPATNWSVESRRELRALWDAWWHEQHKWENIALLTKNDWRLAGVRPLNHPIRRLVALAQWIASGFFQTLEKAWPVDLQTFEPCFWSTHINWSGKEKQAELVGPGRAKIIFLNVIVPYRLTKGNNDGLALLPVEPMNSIIRETAFALLGPNHSPKLYRTALARQGLIQIFNDFILPGRLDEFDK